LDLVLALPEILAHVVADSKKFTAPDQAIHRHLLQSNPPGPSEIFAQWLASAQSTCCVESWNKGMPRQVSSTYQFVKDLVGGLSVTSFLKEDSHAVKPT